MDIPSETSLTLRRPASGVHPVDMAIAGSQSATERVINVYPELGTRPPAGFNLIEWAQLGLGQAIEKVRRAVER